MSVSLFESSFISNPLTSTIKPQKSNSPIHLKQVSVSCRHRPDEQNDSPRGSENKWANLALLAVAAAGVLTLGSVDPAEAGKTGGRVGGQAFRPSAPPRASGPRINNSRTNIYINPRVAPPLGGGYGYGYGGWGWSPFSFFAPGPSVAVGVGGGFDLFFTFILLGAVSAVVRKFFGSRRDEDDDEY